MPRKKTWSWVIGLAILSAASGTASAQGSMSLCKAGQPVEYAKAGRRYPGRVEGDNGRNCLVYAKAYMGVIDVPYADLRPASDATEDGKPDVAPDRTTIATTPREIVDAFARDPAAAKARWLGRRVRVTGNIFTLRGEQVWMKANLYQTAAVCLVEPADRGPIAALKEGEQISVEGSASERGDESIFLQGCKIVKRGAAPDGQAVTVSPPQGRYFCRAAGNGIGYLVLGAGVYSVDGVQGAWRFDAATKRLSFASGSYAKWGWSGEWRTDPDGVGGPPEPRIVLRDGQALKVTCTFQPKGN